MTDFSHLAQLGIVPDKTVRFDLDFLVGPEQAYLKVLPAVEENKEYFNKSLKAQRKNRGKVAIDLPSIQKNRASDRALYPKCIIKDWGNMKDTAGNDVPFSVEAAQQFLQALPDHLFDELREFCQNYKNFDLPDHEITEDIAKN